MRLPRMTTRRWMMAVALAGLAAWPEALRITYRRRADEHGRAFGRLYQEMTGAAPWRQRERVADDWVRRRPAPGRPFSEEAVIAVARHLHDQLERQYGRRLQYHRAMERKYEQAALRPWIPILPDPPPPR